MPKESNSALAVAASAATSLIYKTHSSLRLDLPKFGGDPVKWKMFLQLFDVRMQKEPWRRFPTLTKESENSMKISALAEGE